MHPIILAYVRWSNLYKLVVFVGRSDLEKLRKEAWQFLKDLRERS